MAKNPVGVYIVEHRYESNGPRIAGYLGCSSTGYLRKLLDSAHDAPKIWAAERDNDIGVVRAKSYPNFERPKLFRWLTDQAVGRLTTPHMRNEI